MDICIRWMAAILGPFEAFPRETLRCRGRRTGARSLLYRAGDLPAKISRLDLATGEKQSWREIMPSDSAGITDIGPILITPDSKSYVYEYGRTLSDLYLVEGFK